MALDYPGDVGELPVVGMSRAGEGSPVAVERGMHSEAGLVKVEAAARVKDSDGPRSRYPEIGVGHRVRMTDQCLPRC